MYTNILNLCYNNARHFSITILTRKLLLQLSSALTTKVEMSKKAAKKAAVLSEEEAGQRVLAYLQKQNRPYNATDTYNNLGSAIGKAQVAKALAKLSEDGSIIEKVYGKQKIYCVVQSGEKYDAAYMSELQATTAKLREDLNSKIADKHAKEKDRAEWQSELSTDTLVLKIAEIEQSLVALQAQSKVLNEGQTNYTTEDVARINNAYSIATVQYKKRKRVCDDLLGQILEGCPKKKECLMEEIGIETDESVGFTLRAY
eukprot:CFRG0997T1